MISLNNRVSFILCNYGRFEIKVSCGKVENKIVFDPQQAKWRKIFNNFQECHSKQMGIKQLEQILSNENLSKAKIKESLVKGEIPFLPWHREFQSFSTKKQELTEEINKTNSIITLHRDRAKKLKKKVQALENTIVENSKQLSEYESQEKSLNVVVNFLQPLAEQEKLLVEQFNDKLRKQEPESWGSDDVSMFLSLANVPQLIDSFRELKIGGEELFLTGHYDISRGLRVPIPVLKKFQYAQLLLQKRLFGEKDKLEKCPITRNATPDRLLLLLKEYGITTLNKEIIIEQQIVAGELMLYSPIELQRVFPNLKNEDRKQTFDKIQCMASIFFDFLSNLQ